MRRLQFCVLALLVALIASCGTQSPRDLLLGKWELIEDKEGGTVEFEKDGKFRGTRGFITVQGKYKWTDDKTLEVDVENPLAGLTAKLGKMPEDNGLKMKYTLVSINRDEMVANDAAGKTLKFKRMK